eukprot:scaffold97706_cov54-Phaeocystis_antarctica.AAC.1
MHHLAPPRMATVDDIPSWSRLAPNTAVSFARDQEVRRSRELAEEARLAEAAAAEWLAAWPGGDPDAKDEEGWRALQRAAEAGQAAAVAELLRRPSVEVNGVEPNKGQPALVLASRGGHAAVVRLLLAHAAIDPNQADEEGRTPLRGAAQNGHEAVVRLLLAHAAIDANQARQDGTTPLSIAAQNGHEAVVRLLLAHAAIDPNQATQEGFTPLSIAAQNGHEAVVRLLLAHAAVDANQADQIGRTPLYIAAQNNQEAVVRLLLAHPAVDAERADEDGTTPLLVACDTRSTAAALALLDAKADPNARDNNYDSPLVVAHRGDNAQLLAALVAAGADVTALYAPLVAKCMLGDAHAARRLLLESANAARAFQMLDIDEGHAGIFRMFDTNQSGDIDAEELQQALVLLGMEVDSAQAQQVLAKFDRDGTGKLDLHAFCRFIQAVDENEDESSPALLLEALLSEAPAPEPPGTAGDGEEASLPAHIKVLLACLRGDAAALAALDGSNACEARADGLPPAFCFAAELGDAAVVKAALAGSKGLDKPQRAVLCAQAALAAGTHDAAASGYVPGAAEPSLHTPTRTQAHAGRHASMAHRDRAPYPQAL